MKSAIAQRLLELNQHFYSERGRDFSATRMRLQPGVLQFVDSLRGDESILDLGCGNGALALELSRRGHKGSYLGVDASPTLLAAARGTTFTFPVEFAQADITQHLADTGTDGAPATSPARGWADHPALGRTDWRIVTAFAVLHHIPGRPRRLALLREVHSRLQSGGRFIHSNWQFSTSPRLRARIQPWAIISLKEHDVDQADYLLDWRRGGPGLRYVHEFTAEELHALAAEAGFAVDKTYYSDGANRRSGLYQIWKKTGQGVGED